MPLLDPVVWAMILPLAGFAGVVKGAVGFAMPMILISGLGTFLAPDLALAGLILPTVLSNVLQVARAGVRAAFEASRAFSVYIAIVLVMIALTAQLVRFLPDATMFLAIGIPITLFALTQLLGWRPKVAGGPGGRTGVAVALFAGFLGGISGTWGPPTVAYLTALDTPKKIAVAVQGVVYGTGSAVLLLAHINSGVLTAERAGFSALLCLPAAVGMAVGFRIQDRLDQERFRRVTLLVLVVAGLNLVRRGLVG
ncbi:MAG: sulfite exporter TauE/SafE family protein [Pseudomonadota bacterium]